MKKFIFVYTIENKTFKNYIKGKKNSLNISYIDLQENQEKYLVLENEKFSIKVLECELYEKIYTSIRKLKNSDVLKQIYYFLDTDDEKIILDLYNYICRYKSKIDFFDLEIDIHFIDESNNEECLRKKLIP